MLFVDFNSAFNTIIRDLLQHKLTQLNVSDSIRRWIVNILTNST